jgi:hypothetical protein
MAGFREHSDKLIVTQYNEFFDQLNDYHLLK